MLEIEVMMLIEKFVARMAEIVPLDDQSRNFGHWERTNGEVPKLLKNAHLMTFLDDWRCLHLSVTNGSFFA